MITLVLNDPIRPDGTIDPFYNPNYTVTPWTLDYWPGGTTYLDTPIVPTAAFTTSETNLDTEPADGTPRIKALDGPEPGGGPVLSSTRTTGRTITLQSVGETEVLNPNHGPANPAEPFRIVRDYGFGPAHAQNAVFLNDVPLTIVSWNTDIIIASVPASASTGRITVRRGGTSLTSELGVTLHIVNTSSTSILRVPSDHPTIQSAIDAASPGALILVAPGTYNENVIMWKPVRLQGAAAGGTFIDGNPNPPERLQAWHERINAMGGRTYAEFLLKDPFAENEAPTVIVMGEVVIVGVNLQIPGGSARTVLGLPFTTPGQALVDGFTLSGSKAGSGLFAVGGAKHLVVSNNNVTNNQGNYGGGIVLGTQDSGFDCRNDNIIILNNKIHRNGGVQGGGGICANEASRGYLIDRNLVIGNFSRFNGAGIQHRGVSGGECKISRNKILFNENFFGAVLNKAGEGGGIYVGGDVAGGTGAGNVTIDGNLIQGNIAGAGHGGGIAAFFINGDDVRESPDSDSSWYRLTILNNMIVNNVSALSGAGIYMQDAARATILHNTIARNDCTASALLAFEPGQLNSTPQPAGVVASPHTNLLTALFGQTLAETHPAPLLADSIIYQNRSFFNDASLNGNQGGLAPNPANPYWDLAIEESTGPSSPALNPQRCVLTSRIDPRTGHDYGPTSLNNYSNPLFVSPYFNTLQSGSVLDEGGNFISIRFTPISVGTSNYHIQTGSPAIGFADMRFLNFVGLARDFDNQRRPNAAPDSGADEFYAAGATNATPMAVNDVFSMRRGTVLNMASLGVLANDVDADNTQLQAILVTNVSNGTLSLNSNGGFRYTPTTGFTGTTTFTYRVSDGTAQSNVATVSIRVRSTSNTPPVAQSDAYSFDGITALEIPAPGVLRNDNDANGDSFWARLALNPAKGVLTLIPNGSFRYVPNPGFTGSDTFIYRAFDGTFSNLAWVTISVDPGVPQDNIAPAPIINPIMIAVDTVGTTVVSPNDSNPLDTHTFAISIQPLHGTAIISPLGILTYTPNPGFVGNDTLEVTVTDQGGAAGSAPVEITVMPTLHMPPSGMLYQSPPDTDGIDTDGDGIVDNDHQVIHLGAGDGFVRMADQKVLYMFGFSDLTGVPLSHSFHMGMLGGESPAPTIKAKEGQKLYINLTNVGMVMRPDLFDAHTIHWHGFPQAAPIFDGMPDSAIAIKMGGTIPYFYNVKEPGTYLYHCHVEAVEHMQMGMIGNLYVTPKQDGQVFTYPAGSGRSYSKFAYNDGDGSTGYDVDYPVQMTSFDPAFHNASRDVQPLPFYLMKDKYALLNGRGYPDTVNPAPLEPLEENEYKASQKVSSLITASAGQRILLRISNVSVTRFFTLQSLSLPMTVVGQDAKLLRGSNGEKLFYATNSVTLGGGQSCDAIIDTAGVAPGTYMLYTTNLNYLSNNKEDFGGMMTEIVVQ